MEDRDEVCLAEEVERLRRFGLSDGEIANRMGGDASWVETLVSPGEDEPGPESEDLAARHSEDHGSPTWPVEEAILEDLGRPPARRPWSTGRAARSRRSARPSMRRRRR